MRITKSLHKNGAQHRHAPPSRPCVTPSCYAFVLRLFLTPLFFTILLLSTQSLLLSSSSLPDIVSITYCIYRGPSSCIPAWTNSRTSLLPARSLPKHAPLQ